MYCRKVRNGNEIRGVIVGMHLSPIGQRKCLGHRVLDQIPYERLAQVVIRILRKLNGIRDRVDKGREVEVGELREEREGKILCFLLRNEAQLKPIKYNFRVDACESKVEIVTPYWASNSAGKIRAIVNTQHFEQAIHQEVCT